MMAKKLILMLAVVLCILSLTACCFSHKWSNATCTEVPSCIACGKPQKGGMPLGHSWTDATCTTAKTCTTCASTEGKPLGHSWTDATCTTAKTCTICAYSEGSPLGHSWTAATCEKASTCTRCQATEGDALGHAWKAATYTQPQTCSQCGLTAGEPKNIFEENSISPLGESVYNNSFAEYFSAEEYVSLYKTLEALSITPKLAINETLFIAYQYFATYNTTEEHYLLMDVSGNILRDYGDNGWPAVSTSLEKMGNYSFIPLLGNPATFELIDEKGNLISIFEAGNQNHSIEYVCSLGSDYHVFIVYLSGSFRTYLLSPQGEICFVRWPSNSMPYTADLENEMEKGKLVIGNVSEGLFSLWYKGIFETHAFYFDISGERIIDLSSGQTNYHIRKMGAFEDGQAKIHLTGADGKEYSAIIDTAGQFVSEPEIEQ